MTPLVLPITFSAALASALADLPQREAIALLRADRVSAVYNGEKRASRAKTKAAIPDALDMLSELEGL